MEFNTQPEQELELVEDLSEDEMLLQLEEEEARIALEMQQRKDAMFQLGVTVEQKFTEYAGERSDKEDEWYEAIRQLEGFPDTYENKYDQVMRTNTNEDKRRPTVNITRQKTNIAVSRMQDIQFPMGGDFNFFVKATPDPEMLSLEANPNPMPAAPEVPGEGVMEGMPQEGMPTIGQVATNVRSEANEKARNMYYAIADNLVESSYGKKARTAIKDLCELGTGILKGPTMQYKVSKSYTSEQASDGADVSMLNMEANIKPTVQRVDPRLFYPDPNARTPDEMEDAIELHLLSRKQIIALQDNPAFENAELALVLETEPAMSTISGTLDRLSITSASGNTIKNRYLVKEYHGPIDKEVLFLNGDITEADKDNPLFMQNGEVWVANNIVIRMSLSHIEGDDSLPYGVCSWDTDPSSLFGHGVPYLMRNPQRVVNASWKMLLDNAGLTAGPQIIINKEMIEPANPSEGWGLAPMKVWYMTEYGTDVREAMQFVNIPTQQESLGQVIEMALGFADMESSIPLIHQGEMPAGNNTLGGMAMVMSASNVVQRAASMRWDDYITVRLIERFYHYQMQYSDDPAIKGDFEINAGGATDRIDQQQRAQDIERLLGMAGAVPSVEEQIDMNMAVRELIETSRLGDILKTPEQVASDAEIAAQQAGEQAPADPALVKAETANKKMELDAQLAQMEIDAKLMELAVSREKSQIQLQIESMKLKAAMAEASTKEGVEYAKLENSLNIAEVNATNARLLKEVDISQFREEIQIKKEMGTGI